MKEKKQIKIDKKQAWRIASNLVYPLVSFALVLAIWAIVAKVKDNPLVMPMPDVVIESFFSLCKESGFWTAVGMSLARTLICFVISFVAALALAALGGLANPVHRIISPIVTFLRSAPTVAVILILYAFATSNFMAVSVGFLVAFPIMYSAFYGAISGVDKDLVEMAKVYKVSPWNKVAGVYLPSVAECLFDTSKSTLSLTLKVVVAAEILAGISKSIGGKISVANATFEIAYLLAWTLVAIALSFAIEGVVAIFKKIWQVTR